VNLVEVLKLRKAKYLKRMGSSGHYKYTYKEADFNVKKIDIKKVANSASRRFKTSIIRFFPKVMTGEQKVKLKEMINSRNKILIDLLNGVNKNKLVSFEGQGILSGLDKYYRLVGYNDKTGEVDIKKKGSNKVYTKRIESLLSGKEKYNIK